MEQMEQELTARVPTPWLDFIKTYTYPQVDSTLNAGYTNTDPENSVGSCIADNLAVEGKQLGQDILDDAIASQFHKALCNRDFQDELQKKVDLGLIPPDVIEQAEGGVDIENIEALSFAQATGEARKNIGSFAIEQAFRELDERDQVFTSFCALVLSGFTTGDTSKILDLTWEKGLDRLGVCGLFDLMIDAIQCLLGGLTLEEALGSIVNSALAAMSIESFGELFVGLPPEKQEEINQLVQEKLESGDIFPDDSQAQRVSDELAKSENQRVDVDNDSTLDVVVGPSNWVLPWEDLDTVNEQNDSSIEGPYEGSTPSGIPTSDGQTSAVESATSRALLSTDNRSTSTDTVMQAYITALLEVYSDDLLDLVDELNNFPGAEIIAKVLAVIDCPTPPIFEPNLMDFIKDIDLPFCRNTDPLVFPRFANVFGYIPKLKDLFRLLFLVIKAEIQKLIINIIMKLIIKVCELIGNAICKALEAVGDLAAATPDLLTGRTTFKDVVRETICGPDVPDEQIDNTIVDLFETLGAGGSEFADAESVLAFAEDLSSATTRREITDAVLGDPSETFLSVIQSLVEFEYPQFASSFNNRQNISSFFGNVGNLMPAATRQALKDFSSGLDEDEQVPANPSLCASPDQIEDFCSLRSGLLEGRASPEQIAKLCDSARNTFKDDLADLTTILNDGIPNYLNSNLPPLVSDPGCDNGLAPYEPEEIAQATTDALDGNMEALKLAYTYDMIGNGPGERNWGFINMVLSDTMGNPYTAHLRKSVNSGRIFKKNYVDFYVDPGDTDADEDTKYARLSRQDGAFPIYVADWLASTEDEPGEMQNRVEETNFSSNNVEQDDQIFTKTFKDLNFDGLFSNVNLLTLPDYGYNTSISVNFEDEVVEFNRKARKKNPDLQLSFRDNAKGTADEGGFSYGFDFKLFVSDIEKNDEGDFVNRFDDNARVIITNVVNTKAEVDASDGEYKEAAEESSKNDKEAILKWRAYEFLATDNGLDNLDLESYPRFYTTSGSLQNQIPQVYMLQDIIEKAGGTPPRPSEIKAKHDQVMDTLLKQFSREVYTNLPAFEYGANLDDLTYDDVEYGVVDDAGNFVEYSEYASSNEITNEDAVLGLSRDQYENEQSGTPDDTRVFYLDPASFGGTYFNPPVYIKPLKNTGWLGFVNVMFPEISPCKPYRVDVIDFGSIQERIDSTYSTIPEDDRLKSEPDCSVEEPYNRILERPAKAGIEGLISAAIRMYASIHLLKAAATFSKFKPDFRNTFSSIYAQYIIERMEEDFKDANPGPEVFSPFKDEEFWYAFLEQSVQTYARRYADGQLPDPPGPVIDALVEINNVIENHHQIYKNTYTADDGVEVLGLRDARKNDDAGPFQNLKSYRSDKNLEVVQETQQYAKIILQELVIEELQHMGDVYIKNMQDVGLAGDDLISDARKYLLESLTAGSSLDIDKEIKEEIDGSEPEEAENLYTAGGMLVTEDGEDYVGYYHIHPDEAGDLIYMAGAYHTDEPHEILRIYAEKITVPIGSVNDIGTVSTTTDKPFAIEKYVRIEDTYYPPEEAREIILNSGTEDTNISDVYPGTMELVYDENGAEIGIQGELGVRYGLRFSIDAGAGMQTLVEVEVDALDLPVTQFQPLEPDSKLLLCLVNNLLDDPEFNAVVKYIFPLNKILSTIAIYNDLAFVPSIGEVVVENAKEADVNGKPGRFVTVTDEQLALEDGASGWFTAEDRSPGFFKGNGLFLLHYDKWDQNVLLKSKIRLKKLFKRFYNSRDFDPEETDSVSEALISQLAATFRPATGQRLLPWWKRRMLRSNPFNADGALCDKKD
jgi:hypothetical protein